MTLLGIAIPVNSPYRPILHALADCRCSREDVISLEDVIPLDRCTRKLAGVSTIQRSTRHFYKDLTTEYRIVGARKAEREAGRPAAA